MRFGTTFILGSAFLFAFASLSGCGGKVYDGGEGDAGSAGAGGSGGFGGSGGTVSGGSGGGPSGSGGGPAGGGGSPAGSGGGPAGGGGSPAGSGGGPAGGGGSPAGSGGGPAGGGGSPAGSGGGPAGGGGGPAGSGGSATCWNYLPPYTPCRECMDSNCCAAVDDCFEDPTGYCPYAIECFEDCPMGDPFECAQMCDGGNFNVPFNNLITCGANACPGECMSTTPPPPDCPVTSGDPQCDNCINTECGYECNTCMNNNMCVDLLICISECYDEACQEECFYQYPGGVDDLMAFIGGDGCLSINCGYECGF